MSKQLNQSYDLYTKANRFYRIYKQDLKEVIEIKYLKEAIKDIESIMSELINTLTKLATNNENNPDLEGIYLKISELYNNTYKRVL